MYTLEYGLVFNKEDTLDTRFFTYLVFNVNLLMYGLQRERERRKKTQVLEWRGEEEVNLFLLLHSLSAMESGTETSVRKPSFRAS